MSESWLHLRSYIRHPQYNSLPEFVEQIIACFANVFAPTTGMLPYTFRSMTPVHGKAETLAHYDHHVARAKVMGTLLTELLVKFTVPARNPYIISPDIIENRSIYCTIKQINRNSDYIDVQLSLCDANAWFDPYPVPLPEEYGFVQEYLKQGFILQRDSKPCEMPHYVGNMRLSQINRQKVFDALQHYIRLVQLEWFVATYEESLAFDIQENRLFFKTHSELEAQWLIGPIMYFLSPSITFDDLVHVRNPNTYFTIAIDSQRFYLDEETFGFLQQ